MSDQGFSGNPSTPFLTTFSQGAQFANAPSPIFAWDINQWLPKACPRIALRVIRPSQNDRSPNQRTERSAAASYHRHALPRLQQHFRLNPVKSSTSNRRGSDRTRAAFECAVPANYLQEPPLPLLGKEGESALRWGGAYIALLAMCATRRAGPLTHTWQTPPRVRHPIPVCSFSRGYRAK